MMGETRINFQVSRISISLALGRKQMRHKSRSFQRVGEKLIVTEFRHRYPRRGILALKYLVVAKRDIFSRLLCD